MFKFNLLVILFFLFGDLIGQLPVGEQTDLFQVLPEEKHQLSVEFEDAYFLSDLIKLSSLYKHRVNHWQYQLYSDAFGNQYILENRSAFDVGLLLSKAHFLSVGLNSVFHFIQGDGLSLVNLNPSIGYQIVQSDIKAGIRYVHTDLNAWNRGNAFFQYENQDWKYLLLINQFKRMDLSFGLFYSAKSRVEIGLLTSSSNIPFSFSLKFSVNKSDDVYAVYSWHQKLGAQKNVGSKFTW